MWSLFSRRDWRRFPDDEVGNTLHKLTRNGREALETIGIDLSCAFADERDARDFLARVRLPRVEPVIESPDEVSDGRWHVETMREASPTHAAVTVAIADMRRLAETYRGTLSGWHLFW